MYAHVRAWLQPWSLKAIFLRFNAYVRTSAMNIQLQSRLRMVYADPKVHRNHLAILMVDKFVLVGSDVSFIFGGVEDLGGSDVVRRDVQ